MKKYTKPWLKQKSTWIGISLIVAGIILGIKGHSEAWAALVIPAVPALLYPEKDNEHN